MIAGMAQRTNVYGVLYSYARKNESPFVEPEPFLAYFAKYVKRTQEEQPEGGPAEETSAAVIWLELNHLEEQGKITINTDDENRIYLCHYYVDQILEAYKNPDNDADLPFPDEHSLRLTIPQEQIKPLDVTIDLEGYLKEPQETDLPIICLSFPNEHGTALALASMIPVKILESSMLKVRNFLAHRGNREYVQHKLAPQLTGKEDHLREILDQVQVRPLECVKDIRDARESVFYFWAYFCNLLRNELTKKNELLAEETGALQSAHIIEICNSFFKAKAAKAKEVELALKNFELELDRPPYYFSRDAIARFKDNKGVPLLGQYSQDGLDAYITKRVSESVSPDELPDLLYFRTADNAAWLIKKTKVLPLCVRLFAEARAVVIKTISKHWKKLLLDFLREPAMEDDREFEKLIIRYVEEYAPVLTALLKDRRLYLIHGEMQHHEKGLSESFRLFSRDELLPLRVLLMLKRKEMLTDVKLLLPFWYSIPIISSLIAFFTNLGKRKKIRREQDGEGAEKAQGPDIMTIMQDNAKAAVSEFVPEGHTVDSYLTVLSARWGKLLNKQLKENLVTDVNTLVRDRLRLLLRTQKKSSVNPNTFDKLTETIMQNSSGLYQITEQNALFLYIKIYLVKLCLGKIR
jgi:hypothetical protein